jgi:radical SAM superfamily enzyme YgiQ (UPF0313 family)
VEHFQVATVSVSPPLGLAYIAGALEANGRSFSVLDAVAEAPTQRTRYCKGYLIGLRHDEMVRRIPSEAKGVGISAIFTHEWPSVVHLIDLISKSRPDLMIAVGGEHVTAMPEFCLATSKADFVVMGEGEEIIIDLLDCLDENRPLAQVDGIAFREGGSVIVNSRRDRQADVDAIPRPAWQHFDLQTYADHHYIGGIDISGLSVPLLATRGCPYQCTYCSAPNMWTPRWIARDPVLVVDEVQHYVEKFGASNFPFQDLTAIVKKDWIVSFCKEILKRDLKISWQFPSGTRCEAIDDETADLMLRAGLLSIAYAPETGSERTRKLIKKKMKTEHLMASVKSAVSAGLDVCCFIVIGFPHDTAEDLGDNAPFLKKLKKLGVANVAVNYYSAYPGTEIFNSLYDAGKIKIDEDYFSQITNGAQLIPDCSHNDRISRWDLVLWKIRLLYSFYGTMNEHGKRSGMLSSVWKAVSGIISGKHSSRLQTAFRIAVVSASNIVKVRFIRPWIPRRQETLMFAEWDDICRSIRQQKLDKDIAKPSPADTAEIHQSNVIADLKRDHGSARTLTLNA